MSSELTSTCSCRASGIFNFCKRLFTCKCNLLADKAFACFDRVYNMALETKKIQSLKLGLIGRGISSYLQHADTFGWQSAIRTNLICDISTRIEQSQWRVARERFSQIAVHRIVGVVNGGQTMQRFVLVERFF